MSRPWISVPNGKSAPGGISAFIRLASSTGSVSWIIGAAIATATAMPTRTPPIQREEPPFSFIGSAVADARSDRDVGEIDQRVDDEEEYHDHQDAALDRRYVALEYRVDHQRADPGPGEQFLDHHRLAHQRAEL